MSEGEREWAVTCVKCKRRIMFHIDGNIIDLRQWKCPRCGGAVFELRGPDDHKREAGGDE